MRTNSILICQVFVYCKSQSSICANIVHLIYLFILFIKFIILFSKKKCVICELLSLGGLTRLSFYWERNLQKIETQSRLRVHCTSKKKICLPRKYLRTRLWRHIDTRVIVVSHLQSGSAMDFPFWSKNKFQGQTEFPPCEFTSSRDIYGTTSMKHPRG